MPPDGRRTLGQSPWHSAVRLDRKLEKWSDMQPLGVEKFWGLIEQMRSNVVEFSPRPIIEKVRTIPLVEVPSDWKDAIVLWTYINQTETSRVPLFMNSKVNLVNDYSMIVSGEQSTKGAVLFAGASLRPSHRLVAEAIIDKGIAPAPDARSYYLSTGQTIGALTLGFASHSQIDLILFRR